MIYIHEMLGAEFYVIVVEKSLTSVFDLYVPVSGGKSHLPEERDRERGREEIHFVAVVFAFNFSLDVYFVEIFLNHRQIC